MLVVSHIRGGVPVLVHWSVPALALFVLGTGIDHIANAAAWVVGYLAILVVHELGHHIAAGRRGARVIAIAIYPLHGECKHEAPRSAHDEAFIAFGGPAAQLIVAVPFATSIMLFGSTRVGALDILSAVLGVLSPMVALFNLLPIRPLDGRRIWTSLTHARRMRRMEEREKPLTAMEAMEAALRKASVTARRLPQQNRQSLQTSTPDALFLAFKQRLL
ncbi:MAG TPA: site-2 protease family protein [Thermoanaerobaculia bacterium]|nr:site-2 protease family protein [Thermoanaerobaculia bacterium]